MMETLLSRASASSFDAAGPTSDELHLILQAAVRAPDHGKLRPWRFLVVSGDGRAKLSELFAEAARRRDPGANEAAIEKEKSKPLRSALTIVVAAKITRGHKIPEIEQTLSAGAAAMNILNAAHALGYGAKWVTGANCYDAWFKEALGLDPADPIVGFVHIGALPETGQPAAERPDPRGFTSTL
jgi:nitroreductase